MGCAASSTLSSPRKLHRQRRRCSSTGSSRTCSSRTSSSPWCPSGCSPWAARCRSSPRGSPGSHRIASHERKRWKRRHELGENSVLPQVPIYCENKCIMDCARSVPQCTEIDLLPSCIPSRFSAASCGGWFCRKRVTSRSLLAATVAPRPVTQF